MCLEQAVTPYGDRFLYRAQCTSISCTMATQCMITTPVHPPMGSPSANLRSSALKGLPIGNICALQHSQPLPSVLFICTIHRTVPPHHTMYAPQCRCACFAQSYDHIPSNGHQPSLELSFPTSKQVGQHFRAMDLDIYIKRYSIVGHFRFFRALSAMCKVNPDII